MYESSIIVLRLNIIEMYGRSLVKMLSIKLQERLFSGCGVVRGRQADACVRRFLLMRQASGSEECFESWVQGAEKVLSFVVLEERRLL